MTVEVKADQVFLCIHESSGSDIVRWIRLLRMAYCIVHRWMDGWTSVKEVKEAPCSVLSEFQISLFLCLFCDKVCLQTFWKTRSCDTWTPCCVLVSWQSENIKLSNLIVCDKKWPSIWIRNNQEGKEKTHLLSLPPPFLLPPTPVLKLKFSC